MMPNVQVKSNQLSDATLDVIKILERGFFPKLMLVLATATPQQLAPSIVKMRATLGLVFSTGISAGVDGHCLVGHISYQSPNATTSAPETETSSVVDHGQ